MSFNDTPDILLLNNDEAVEKVESINVNEIKIFLKQETSISNLLNKLSSKYNISSVRTEHISLHDIFIDKVNKDKGECNE